MDGFRSGYITGQWAAYNEIVDLIRNGEDILKGAEALVLSLRPKEYKSDV